MPPDFDREVWCLLGLPFDALGMNAAVQRVERAARERRPCFLSTPNLNFVVAAQADAAFRDSVLHSDLSTVDGMPLVWVARLLGLPLRERVAGANLFERLRSGTGSPLGVFFFGGAEGVAARACERLNAKPGMLRCVGFDTPGFEPVPALSGEARIAAINASAADFVVVALGARKGQAWIEHNRARLGAPVISHLGAVLNFVAGSVERAPPWLQRVGLEWVWRIGQEPALWRRYAGDGWAFARLLVTRVLPAAVMARVSPPAAVDLQAARVSLDDEPGGRVLRLSGAWTQAHAAPLRSALKEAARSPLPLRVDLAGLSHVDSAVIALLALLRAGRVRDGHSWCVHGTWPRVASQFRRACADYVLQAAEGPAAGSASRPDRVTARAG